MGFVAAQVRVATALVAAYDPPALGWSMRVLRGAPRIEEAAVGGVPSTIFRPGRGRGPWPAVILFPGVTRLGRGHPALVGLGRGLAAAGYLAVVAEPVGLAAGELTGATVLQARAAVDAVASRRDTAHGRVALLGVSGGATLALVSASHPDLAGRVSAVAAVAPLCDIEGAIRVVTTGMYLDGESLVPFASGDFFRLVIAKSVVGCLPEGRDRSALQAHLRSLDDYGPNPLAGLRAWPVKTLESGARTVVELLANEDPGRFHGLLASLPVAVRAAIESLSAVASASAITAPVEVVAARRDKYVPLVDSTSFAAACSSARLTILELLDHAVPRLSVRGASEIARLDGVLVRVLAASYSGR